MKNKYDVIIIGSGPGGEGAAMKLAKEGKQLAVIDDVVFVFHGLVRSLNLVRSWSHFAHNTKRLGKYLFLHLLCMHAKAYF